MTGPRSFKPIPVGGFAGVAVYINQVMSPGTVEFRDANGEPIGWVFNVAEIHIGQTATGADSSTARMEE